MEDNFMGSIRDTLIFSKYGGINLLFIEYLDKLIFDPTLIKRNNFTLNDLDNYKPIIKSLYHLRNKIHEMNQNGYFHNDIGLENIVYNEKEEKSYLIDFEKASNTQNGLHEGLHDDVMSMDSIIHDLESNVEKLEELITQNSSIDNRGNNKSRHRRGRKHKNISTKMKNMKKRSRVTKKRNKTKRR
jgi:tRNA A-37 threonylcarbamoyl transferase component Bud32